LSFPTRRSSDLRRAFLVDIYEYIARGLGNPEPRRDLIVFVCGRLPCCLQVIIYRIVVVHTTLQIICYACIANLGGIILECKFLGQINGLQMEGRSKGLMEWKIKELQKHAYFYPKKRWRISIFQDSTSMTTPKVRPNSVGSSRRRSAERSMKQGLSPSPITAWAGH